MGLTATDETASRKETITRDGSLDRVRGLEHTDNGDRQNVVRDGSLDKTRAAGAAKTEPEAGGTTRSGSLDDVRGEAASKQGPASIKGKDTRRGAMRDGALKIK